MTKHQELLRYIEELPVGDKISVRQMAKDMDVSDGTAYRAIKEAENRGLVSAVPRVGTVRIEEAKAKRNIQRLTFAEVVNIVDGSVLGGRSGLHKPLSRFLIGAMEISSMLRYIEPDSLLIVGDRVEAQRVALEMGAAVLITGGFDAQEEIRDMADDAGIPVISSSYDTFTIATMINRAIYDRMIKKDIVTVEDVMVGSPISIKLGDKVSDWLELVRLSGHSRFPVVDHQRRVVGMVTSRDVAGVSEVTSIDKIMTKKPYTTGLKASLASVAHLMVWHGIELVPVVEDKMLVGVVTRQDVIKAQQFTQRQPQVQMTQADIVISQFNHREEQDVVVLEGAVPPVAMDRAGNVSPGAILNLLSEAAKLALRRRRLNDLVIEAISIYFLHPIPLEAQIEIKARPIDVGRKVGKVELAIFQSEQIVCKAMASLQSLNQ